MNPDVYAELEWRGLVHQSTDPALGEHLQSETFTAYGGFDPTGPSLTTGHLLQLIRLRRLQEAGHRVIALAGGGTGLIGDPGGRETERPLLTREEIEENVERMRPQIENLLDFSAPGGAVLLNNADWLSDLGAMDFLRDVGKHFTVNWMVAKESVKARFEDREQGISFTEFSYMLLQSYDYLWLYDHEGCRLQVGGSDQWGNITAGIELIRRARGAQAYGLTSPLILNAAGRKMSKSEGEAVWLDAEMTSPYLFYQDWLNTDDARVVQLLKFYTFLSRDEVEALADQVENEPSLRQAQRILAEELTRLVHGDDELRRAKEASQALFSGEVRDLDERTLLEVFKDAPSSELPQEELNSEVPLTELLVRLGLSKSKAEARTHIEGGGITINSEKVSDVDASVTRDHLLFGRYLLVRRGKRTYHLVKCG